MVEQESLHTTAQLAPVQRFFQETSVRGLRPEDAHRSANGCFNHCLFLDQGYVLRVPRESEERNIHTQAITDEFKSIAPGITFKLRPAVQQVTFIDSAKDRGLMMPDVIDMVDNAVLMKMFNGVTLDKYVQQAPENINSEKIKKVVTHLAEAHKKGIVIGDRWNANTMITDDSRGLVELDHDIRLKGNFEKTTSFELAQTLFHLVHFSHGHRDFMRDTLLDMYAHNPQLLVAYNLKHVRTFLLTQALYHYNNFQTNGDLYEGFVPPSPFNEIREFVDGMKEIKTFQNKIHIPGTTIYKAA